MMEEELDFCKDVESLILNDTYDSYIDAVLHVCEEYGLEPFIAARMLNKPLKEKIKKEGQDMNLLPKRARLPIK